MTKLFVSDIDGTFINSKHEVTEKTKEAMKLLKDNGYDLALCSGRVMASVQKNIEIAGIDAYAIGSNGGVIAYKNKVLYGESIPYEKIEKILEIGKEKGYGFHMYDHDTYYSNFYDKERLKHLHLEDPIKKQANAYFDTNVLEHIIENDIPIYKVMLHMSFHEDTETYDRINSLGGLYLAMSGRDSSDIMIDGVNKGRAVQYIVENLGKKYDKIVTIGDHENDLPMIEYADIGIAMGNAIDTVKNKSDYITDTNDNEGLFKAVKYVIESENND